MTHSFHRFSGLSIRASLNEIYFHDCDLKQMIHLKLSVEEMLHTLFYRYWRRFLVLNSILILFVPFSNKTCSNKLGG